MIKAVIFDLDDTLIDWRNRDQDWQEFDRKHLGQVFDYVKGNLHPIRDMDDFCALARELTIEQWQNARSSLKAPHLGVVLVEACARQGVPRDLLVADDLLDAYNWGPFPGVVVFPDSLEVLPDLKARGLKLGLITNAYQPIRMRDRELEAFGLIEHLSDCRISAADAGVIKPHPEIFEMALDCLGVSTEEAVFIGDSLEADIAGAQSAGMRAVQRISDDFDTDHHQIVPDAKITSLHELYDLFDEWYPGWQT